MLHGDFGHPCSQKVPYLRSCRTATEVPGNPFPIAATGSLTIKVSFPNPEGHLYSGIQGTVVIKFDEKDLIVIPQNAVIRLQDKALVYKVKADSTATAVDVTTQDTGNGKDFIITSGLNVGDRIVTTGANNVTEGQKVLFPEEVKSDK